MTEKITRRSWRPMKWKRSSCWTSWSCGDMPRAERSLHCASAEGADAPVGMTVVTTAVRSDRSTETLGGSTEKWRQSRENDEMERSTCTRSREKTMKWKDRLVPDWNRGGGGRG